LIVAFYSFKGGVGRTTALAYTAHILASQGYRIVAMDFDLEAPGLTSIFAENSSNYEDGEKGNKAGLMELLFKTYENEGKIDIFPYLKPISTPGKGEIFCLSAGKLDKAYVHQLFALDFQSFYRKHLNPLHQIIEYLKKSINPHFILIDARTGLSEINAPLLLDLNDVSIIFFYPHPQTKSGFDMLTQVILSRKNMRGFTPELRFVISPIPPSDKGGLFNKGLEWVHKVVDHISKIKKDKNSFSFTSEDVTHGIRYQERIAFSEKLLYSESDILTNYRPLAEWLTKYIPKNEELVVQKVDPNKENVLSKITFETGIAEDQANLNQFFVKTDDFSKGKQPDIVLVLGRKGTGKTALFRMLSENPSNGYKPIIIQAPKSRKSFMLGVDGFRELEKHIKKYQLGWDVLWSCYCLLVIYRVTKIKDQSVFSKAALNLTIHTTSLEMVNSFKRLINQQNIAMLSKDQIRHLNNKFSNGPLWLFFDGLDTEFGSREDDLRRRKEAIAGLFSLWYELQDLKYIRWKIFLRQDIWEAITFQNKSHLYGKSLTLKWEKNDFYKTVLKQALTSPFRTFVEKRLQIELDDEIELWPEERMNKVIFQLVAERMRGGRTAFTINWIWNRLGDGNGDHSPRYLFQLFREAVLWEREEQKKNPYDRSILRPRALIQVFSKVSEQVITALKEEYPELSNFIEWLRNKRSPLGIKEISNSFNDEKIYKLAQNIGLLSIYEEVEGDILRFAVPDLYLKGLNMTRKGQA
jgi:MinD-like ATPase involved in chromosome partitioning or flagellar assembly